MKETEAGQSQQDEEDEIWQDPRIVALIDRHNKNDDEHRAARKQLEAELADARKVNEFKSREITKHKNAIQAQDDLAHKGDVRLVAVQKEAEDAKAAAAADKKRYNISEGLMKLARNESIAFSSALKEETSKRHQLEEEFDEAGVYNRELQQRIDSLESEVASLTTVATENTTLKGEIAEVHSSFEDVFSNMAKGLTIDEKFAYAREHQNDVPAGRPRILSTSSLHEELDDHSDDHSEAASEHIKPTAKEPFSLSGITSVETVPVAAPIAALDNHSDPLSFSGISSVETIPVTIPVAALAPATISATKTNRAFAFSGITSTETDPVAAPVSAVKPFHFSGMTVAETVPVLPATTKTTAPLGFSTTTSVETVPVAPVLAPTKKPVPEVRVHLRNRYITEHVNRPVVPWWMWLLFLTAIILCASGFAGLLREKQIWLDANDLAYQRLMGAEQETLLVSVSMGVQNLLPGMGGMGLSLFG